MHNHQNALEQSYCLLIMIDYCAHITAEFFAKKWFNLVSRRKQLIWNNYFDNIREFKGQKREPYARNHLSKADFSGHVYRLVVTLLNMSDAFKPTRMVYSSEQHSYWYLDIFLSIVESNHCYKPPEKFFSPTSQAFSCRLILSELLSPFLSFSSAK